MTEQQLKMLAEEIRTPAFVFNLDELSERVSKIKEDLGDRVRLIYAMKANPFLTKVMNELTDGLEVCSPGEFRICQRANIPMERIVLSGVHKAEKDIDQVVSESGGRGTYTVESMRHLEILNAVAGEAGYIIEVLLRLTSGNQFGMDENAIRGIISNREAYPNLHIKGIQFYSGTQKKKVEKINKELEKLDSFCMQLQEEYGIELQELEYGPGFYVPYFQGEEETDEQAVLKEFAGTISALQFKGQVTLEMGRFMTAVCGYYFTKIVDQKTNRGENYCIIDGGINHLNYYGQAMAMKIPEICHLKTDTADAVISGKASGEEISKWNICGSLCTVGDVIVRQLPLKSADIGDILIFGRVGAYSVTEGIYLFLSRDLPQVIFYSGADGCVMVREGLPTDTINFMGYKEA